MRIASFLAILAPLTAACEQAPSRLSPLLEEPALAMGNATKVATTAPGPCAKAKQEGALAWIHDDYPAALACAKALKKPLVVDLWAPWCHTCLSMQTTVFADASLKAKADQFVFVALDTDRDVNAAPVAKFPPSAWPTFYVVGPDESVLARFVGAASISQFHSFLEAGARAMTGGAAGADAHLLAAERATAAKDLATAERELEAALAAAPETWPRRPDALVSLIAAKHKRSDHEGCVALAEKAMDQTGNAASASDFLYHALSCSEALAPAGAPPDAARDARIVALRERAVDRLTQIANDPKAPLSVDDRSDALMYLREALASLARKDEAKQVAEQQRTLLDDAAAKAPDPTAASTYNWPRAEVYAFLGRPLDLAPALEKSVRDLPNDYDPPARLGWIYMKGGRLDDAAKWTEVSIKLAYGPRKVRVLGQRADIAAKLGDKATELRFRAEIVKTLEALPPSQTTPAAIAKAKQAVAELEKPVAAN